MAARFQRIVKSERESYVKKVVEHCLTSLTKDGLPTIKGILLAGPADFKNRVRDYELFKHYFDKITLGVIDTSEINKTLVNEVYEKNIELFSSVSDIEIIKQLTKIKEMMVLCRDQKILIGFEETKIYLEQSRVKTLYIPFELNSEKKDIINKLNTYGCDIKIVYNNIITIKTGVDIIGILFY